MSAPHVSHGTCQSLSMLSVCSFFHYELSKNLDDNGTSSPGIGKLLHSFFFSLVICSAPANQVSQILSDLNTLSHKISEMNQIYLFKILQPLTF